MKTQNLRALVLTLLTSATLLGQQSAPAAAPAAAPAPEVARPAAPEIAPELRALQKETEKLRIEAARIQAELALAEKKN
jgi:hypothetical protein